MADSDFPRSTATTAEQQRLEDLLAAFRAAREGLAAVMTDDELRQLGINVDVLDEEP